jgi:hypothetical protein
MSSSNLVAAAPAARTRAPDTLELGIAMFATLHLGLALLMAIAPHAFFTAIGPFGAYNAHYIRDVATFYAALGAGGAISLARPAWRVPVLAITALQYALHSVNHLLDVGRAHPAWTGYFDFFSLAAATLLLVWLLHAAIAAQAPSAPPHSSQGEIT